MSTKNQADNDAIVDQLTRPAWLDPQRWPFSLRRYQHRTVDGETIDVHYTDEGQGPTLVFVHAGMWSFIWRDAIAALRRDHRCITLDFPGTGLSSGGPAAIDITTYPAILGGLLDSCRIETATIVIHDLGGLVGVLAAADRPARVGGLIAANGFAWPPEGLALRTMLRVMGARSTTALLGSTRVIPRLSCSSQGVGRNFDAADRAAFFGPYLSRQNARNFHRTMRSASDARAAFERAEGALAGPLAHLKVDTIFGEKNDPFGFADRWKALFPQARQRIVPGGNHFPMCDDPEGFVECVRAWAGSDPAA